MRVFVLEHRLGCELMKPCAACKVLNHLRISLDSEAFDVYLELMKQAVVDQPDPIPQIEADRDRPTLEVVKCTRPISTKLSQHAPTIGRLLTHTEKSLRELGFTNHAIGKIQNALRSTYGRTLQLC